MKLLTSNTKIDKSNKLFKGKYKGKILQMVPGKGVCKNYKNCIKTCLFFKGYGKFQPVMKGRQKRKDLFVNDLPEFMSILRKELRNHDKTCIRQDTKGVVRLNGFTDIDWEEPEYRLDGVPIFRQFPNLQFMDYSADYYKVRYNPYPNYHLTFSYKGNNLAQCKDLFSRGINIAVIDTPENREVFGSVRSIQGDTHDFRFLDKSSSIVWLTEK